MNVRIRKLAAVENPDVQTDRWEDHLSGSLDNKGSIPVEYEIEGAITDIPKVGSILVIARTKRNGVEAPGLMTTSVVTEVTEAGFNTKNSVYELEQL